MAQVSQLYKDYFLQYASYVIRDRAIPDLVDGLKPVQRRILHSLISLDDGKFHKVANVVGETMKYHPHGDSSIYGALVKLANCDLFIEKQGNYGNILTGEPAAAGRYIECRLLPFAKEVLYNPELTTYIDSYDGRAKEPLVFPAKIPVVLIQGAEGIAVGMSTMILPHNPIEVLDAMSSFIKEEDFVLYPDLPTGGIMDVSGYNDGKGKVVMTDGKGSVWISRLSRRGLSMTLKGEGKQVLALPAMVFDGENDYSPSLDRNVLQNTMEGWNFRCSSNGTISDTGKIHASRNGHLRRYEASHDRRLKVRLKIFRHQ